MQALNLEALYPVSSPCDGGARSACADVLGMDAATVAAEIYSAQLRLSFELDMMNRLWLRRRLTLLAARRSELRRAA